MAESIAVMAIEVISGQNVSVAVDNASAHDPIKYTVLDLVTFPRVERRTTLASRVRIEQWLSCIQLRSRRVIFDGNGIKSLGLSSFRWLWLHRSGFVRELGGCPIMRPNQMVRSIELNLVGITLSMTPVDWEKIEKDKDESIRWKAMELSRNQGRHIIPLG